MNKKDLKFSPGDLLFPKKGFESYCTILLIPNGCHRNEYNCFGIYSHKGVRMAIISGKSFHLAKGRAEKCWFKIASNVTDYLKLFLKLERDL